MQLCGEVKTQSQKYYTNMSLMLLRHIAVVDVKLGKETHCKVRTQEFKPLEKCC